MTTQKTLMVCAAGDKWLNKVIHGLEDVGISSVQCAVPEELWEIPQECSGILISLEEINSLYHWLEIKDIYEQEKLQNNLYFHIELEDKKPLHIHAKQLINNAVYMLCNKQICPVIIALSGREDRDEIFCLQAGAAECVSMLQSVPLVVERIRRQLTKNDEEEGEVLQWNCVIVDRRKRQLRVGKQSCYLSGREYKVLITLLQEKGAVVSRSRLATVLWGKCGVQQHRNLDAVLSLLRRRLKDMGLEIVTRYREGYYLREKQ